VTFSRAVAIAISVLYGMAGVAIGLFGLYLLLVLLFAGGPPIALFVVAAGLVIVGSLATTAGVGLFRAQPWSRWILLATAALLGASFLLEAVMQVNAIQEICTYPYGPPVGFYQQRITEMLIGRIPVWLSTLTVSVLATLFAFRSFRQGNKPTRGSFPS
jgi:hypothetical protein